MGGNLIFGGNLTNKFGWDEDSIVADPLFVDPAKGDFRVKDGSPALKLGFKNFPMDQFGVKKPSLKAIARTPCDTSAGDWQWRCRCSIRPDNDMVGRYLE